MNKQKLEEKLTNGDICRGCCYLDDCGEENEECSALKILKEISGYPSYDNSQVATDKQSHDGIGVQSVPGAAPPKTAAMKEPHSSTLVDEKRTE